MSKNKFIKRLLALGIATVSAVSIIGTAACTPDGGDNGPKKLSKPTQVTADQTNKKITWKGDDNASSYKVYEKKKDATGDPTPHTVAKTSCEYTVNENALLAGVYEYYVVAVGDGTNYSDSDASAKVEYTVPLTTVTVTFKSGDQTVDTKTINKGETVSAPVTTPTNGEKIFTGWYSDENCTKLYDFTKPIMQNTDIYAGWRDATAYDDIAKAENKVILEDFSTTTSFETRDGKDYGKKPGLFTITDKNPTTVVVDGGVAVFKDTATTETKLAIDFGHVKGVVHGYFEATINATGNSWSLFRLVGTSAAVPTVDEVFSIRTKSNKLGYRINKTAESDGVEEVASEVGTYKVEYTVDLDKNEITFVINGKKVAEKVAVPGLVNINGFEFVNGSNGARRFTAIDYVAVAADQATEAEYAAAKNALLDAAYADSVLNNVTGLGNISTGVSELLNTQKGLVTAAAATSYDAVDQAYATAVSALDAKVLDNAIKLAQDTIDNYRSDESFTTNGDAWTAAKNAAKTDIGTATTVAEVVTKLAAQKAALDLIENDTDAGLTTITVSVYAVIDGTAESTALGTFEIKSDASMSADQIKEKLTIPSIYEFGGFYEEEACTTPITTYTKHAESASDNTATIYVKLTSKGDTTPAGTYTYAPVSKTPTPSENAPEGMFAWNETDTGNASDFKFGANTTAITITLKLKAGQTVALTMTDVYTGSTGNASGVKVVATGTGSVSTSDPTSYETSSDNSVKASYTINYTATVAGEVVLTITRNVSKTLRITGITVVVADAS